MNSYKVAGTEVLLSGNSISRQETGNARNKVYLKVAVVNQPSVYICNDRLIKMLQGPPGKKGEAGTCTCNATALMASFTMPKMIQGPKGEQGVSGQEGKQGQMGLTVLTLCKNQTNASKIKNKKNTKKKRNDWNSIIESSNVLNKGYIL